MKHPTLHAKADEGPVYSVDEYARQLGLTVAETNAIINRIRLEIDGPLLSDRDDTLDARPLAAESSATR